MVPSMSIWSKRVQPCALSKRRRSRLRNETSTCNFIIPSRMSRTAQHSTQCSSRTSFSTHCRSTSYKSVIACSRIHFFKNFSLKMIEKRNRLARSPHHHPALDIHLDTDNTPTKRPLSNSPATLSRSFSNTNSRFYPPRSFLSTISRPPNRCLN